MALSSIRNHHTQSLELTRRANLETLLAALALAAPLGCGSKRYPAPKPPLAPAVFQPLQDSLLKSYDELFRIAPTLEFSASQIERMREYLDQAQKHCVGEFDERAKRQDTELQKAQDELKRRSKKLKDAERKRLHCRIQNARILKGEAEMLARNAIPVAFENRNAKLDLIEQWPEELRRIRHRIQSGEYLDRPFGDVKDIGFRDVGRGQEDDVKDGQDAVREMKQAGLMPKELDNESVQKYIEALGRKIAAKSDLRVPAKITVLNSKEINAFALPGGFLFLQRGLLEEADDEAQLAGVVAHELAHAAGRHGHRLMKRATIASIIYQAAQVAALIFTGGVAGIGTYYALQYGFYGLGLVLSLDLLGVSREFEMEADQLGVQYSWNAGYDPSGFVRFFDKLALREGNVQGLSWFRTHPPFYQRMVQTQQEILCLPKKEQLVQQTTDFLRMKDELKRITTPTDEDDKNRPSLLSPETDCPPPPKIDYKPGQRIEDLCSLPS